jgi:HEAT repeat protein
MMRELDSYLNDLASGDDLRAEAAAQRLALLPPKEAGEAAAALENLLSSSETDRRWWAARALAILPHPRAPEMLVSALSDPAAAVRQCAALGLRLRPHEAAVQPLVAALSDDDHLVAELACDALASIGEAAVPALLQVLQAGSRPARLEAVRALAAIGDPRAIPALFAALDEDSALMEYWANEGLERMGVGFLFFKP